MFPLSKEELSEFLTLKSQMLKEDVEKPSDWALLTSHRILKTMRKQDNQRKNEMSGYEKIIVLLYPNACKPCFLKEIRKVVGNKGSVYMMDDGGDPE